MLDKATKKEMFQAVFWVILFLCLVIFSSCTLYGLCDFR